MSSLADRLRGVIGPGSPGAAHRTASPEPRVPNPESRGAASSGDAADVLGGEWAGSETARYLVVERTYLPGHRHGAIALADALPPPTGAWPTLPLLMGSGAGPGPGAQLLFLDLETTGIAGGAGTYAFLVGCAWFDGGRFRVRQLLLSSFQAECALLDELADLAGAAGAVVTYNGKSFDLPLVETRFILHRRSTPFAAMPHLDMLQPARRLWRGGDEGCHLSTLEGVLWGHVREGDVLGFEIPARYFRYVHSGDARPLEAVLEHNRLDLLSLAFLTSRAAQLLEDGPAAARTAREALGLGRLYERGGQTAAARTCYEHAVDASADEPGAQAEALRAHALLSRRLRRYQDAAASWRRLLEVPACPPAVVREAAEALAVHHEHRQRDLSRARAFALQSLACPASVAREQALEYRLARLERKLSAEPPPQLF